MNQAQSMNQPQSLITMIVTSSVGRAASGAGKGDVAYGLLAGLRRLRSAIGAQAGYGAACALDDSVHAQILERALATFGAKPAILPPPGAAASRAAAIIGDAAMTCLTLNAYFPGNTALTQATRELTQRLLEAMGGVPAWAVVSAALHSHEVEDDEEANEGEWTDIAVH